MSSVRAARGFTGRDKIIKFAGCYHGHFDALLVNAGSGVMTSGVPDSAGVPAGCTQDTMTAVYNDLDSVRTLLESAPDQVAAVIVEPVAANMGVVLPKEGFLQGLRELCDKFGAVLIFDEVITGFRLAFGGAAEYFGVTPDMVTYGKDYRCRYAGRRLRRGERDHGNGFSFRSCLSGRNLKRKSGCHGGRTDSAEISLYSS